MSEIKYLDPEQANSIPSIKQQFRFVKKALEDGQTIPDIDQIRANAAKGATAYQKPSAGIPASDLNSTVRNALAKAEGAVSVPGEPGTVGQVLQLDAQGNPAWVTPSAGTTPDSEMSKSSTNAVQNKVITEELDKYAKKDGFYESMGVGTAVNLAGQIERTNDMTYRTSGGSEDIATGTARIEKVSGNTVVWNQLIQNGNFESMTNWGVSSATSASLAVANNVGTVTILKTPTSDYTSYLTHSLKTIIGHNYFVILVTNCPHSGTFTIDTNGNLASINKTVTENVWTTVKAIRTATIESSTLTIYPRQLNGGYAESDSFKVTNVMIFDLTLIYGEEVANSMAANQELGIGKFEDDYKQWFGKPLTYEPYNEGELIPVKMTGLKTTGFNQWDEEWESGKYNPDSGIANVDDSKIRCKNFIDVFPNSSYYINDIKCNILYFDSNKNYIGRTNGFKPNINSFTTTDSTRYIKFYMDDTYGTTYNNDININLSWSGTKDGTYEPYEEHTLPFDVTTLQGKLNGQGELVTPFADGLKKAGSVQDEIYYVGNKVYGVKRVGSVDLGSLNWNYASDLTRFSSSELESTGKTISLGILSASLNSFGYINEDSPLGSTIRDRSFAYYNNKFYLRNLSYTDGTTFKTAMSGVMLYYELAEPLVYELENVELPARFKVNDWGTEEQLHAEGVNSAPAILSVLYGVNAVDVLRRLPQNYTSIGADNNDNQGTTMRKFLNVLGAAMGGTWAITVNENDPTDFDFTFTPNDESDDSSDVTNEGE